MSNRIAFRADASFVDPDTRRFIVARIQEHAAGYWVHETHPTLEAATAAADALNAQYGLTRDDALSIYASSMASSIQLHSEMETAVDPAGRMHEAFEAAEAAFYAALVEAYPEATGGDLDPETAARFTVACQRTAAAWLAVNAPDAMEAITEQLRAMLTDN